MNGIKKLEKLKLYLTDSEILESFVKYLKTNQINKMCDEIVYEYGIEDVLICKRNQFAVNTRLVECDYYKFLENDIEAVNQYHGEYMNQYSWAERTIGCLERY